MNAEYIKELEKNNDDVLDKLDTYQEKINNKKEVLSFLGSVFDKASKQTNNSGYTMVEFYTFFPKKRNGLTNSYFEQDIDLFNQRRNIIRLVCQYIGLKYVQTKQIDTRLNYEGIIIYEQVYVPVNHLNDDFSMDLDKEIDKVLSIKRYF